MGRTDDREMIWLPSHLNRIARFEKWNRRPQQTRCVTGLLFFIHLVCPSVRSFMCYYDSIVDFVVLCACTYHRNITISTIRFFPSSYLPFTLFVIIHTTNGCTLYLLLYFLCVCVCMFNYVWSVFFFLLACFNFPVCYSLRFAVLHFNKVYIKGWILLVGIFLAGFLIRIMEMVSKYNYSNKKKRIWKPCVCIVQRVFIRLCVFPPPFASTQFSGMTVT